MMETDRQREKFFSFDGFSETHEVGAGACKAGLCGATAGPFSGQYPKRCKCGGLIHANISWSEYAYTECPPEELCDRCEDACEYAHTEEIPSEFETEKDVDQLIERLRSP